MKSILFALGLDPGAGYLAPEPSPEQRIYSAEASAWASSAQLRQLKHIQSH